MVSIPATTAGAGARAGGAADVQEPNCERGGPGDGPAAGAGPRHT